MNLGHLLIVDSILQFILIFYLSHVYRLYRFKGLLFFIFAFILVLFQNLFRLSNFLMSDLTNTQILSYEHILISLCITALFLIGIRQLKLNFINSKINFTKSQIEFYEYKQSATNMGEQYATAIESAGVGVWDWDIKSDIYKWNEQMFILWELDKNQPMTYNRDAVWDKLFPEDSEKAKKEISLALEGKKDYKTEFRFYLKDGTVRYIQALGKVFKDETGSNIRMIGVNIDITETKTQEELLRKSELKWKSLVEVIPDYISIYDLEGKYIFLNHFAEGFSAKDIAGKSFHDFIPEDSKLKMKTAFKKAVESKTIQYIEHTGFGDHGSIRNYNNFVVPILKNNSLENILIISRDITEQKEAEKQLQENRERFDAVLTSMTDAVFISDDKGNFTDFNEAFATFHRFKNKKECAKTLAEYPIFLEVYDMEGKLTPHENWAVPRALRGETATNVEHILKRKDTGESWTGSYSLAPIRNPEGLIIGTVVTARDITEMKKIQNAVLENEKLLQMAYQTTNMGIIKRNLIQGDLLIMNERAQSHCGIKKKQVPTKDILTKIHPDDLILLKQKMEAASKFENEGKYAFEYRILHDDGEYHWIAIEAQYIFEGEGSNRHPTQTLTTTRDITSRKNLEKELENYRNQLQNLVEERTKQLTESLEQIKKINLNLTQKEIELSSVNKELEAFSYSVSHDLRAPLRSVDGFSNLIVKKFSNLLPEEGQDYFQRIRNASQRMGSLIDDMLRLSRISRGQVNKEQVDISELAISIVNDLITQDPNRKGDFFIQPNMIAYVDKNLIKIAMQNLLENAWKYTRQKEHTKIEFGSKIENNETIYFVRDNGVGFDMKYVNKLFGAFQRLHSSNEFEGTGIGLATTLRVINKLGGKIWTEAEVDKGATFYFIL